MDDERPASERAAELADRLDQAASKLIALIESIEPGQWDAVPTPGVWSIGKDAEHVSEAGAYHQWIVRLTVGEKVASQRPVIERRSLTTELAPNKASELLRQRTDIGLGLLARLTDDQLDLPTRPPRAGSERLGTTIERVLIGHYDVHRIAIEAKLSARG